MSLRRNLDKLILGLVSAGFIALAGWIYTTGNRVTALETKIPTIDDKLNTIQTDVRDIRNWLMPEKR